MGPLYYTILIAIFLIVLGIIFFKKRDNDLKEDTDPLNIDPESQKDEPILRSRPTGPTSRTMSPKFNTDDRKPREYVDTVTGSVYLYSMIPNDFMNSNDTTTTNLDIETEGFGNGGSFSGGGASGFWNDESDSDSSSSDSYDSDSSDSSSDD